MKYLFLLGSNPQLSETEINYLFPDEEKKLLTSDVLLINFPDDFDPEKTMSRLGGTVKIALLEKTIPKNSDLTQAISDILLNNHQKGRVVFGLSAYGENFIGNQKSLPREIKQNLEQYDLKVRFVLPQEGTSLSSVQVVKENIREIILVAWENEIILARTVAVQDFEDWGDRDYKRPCVSPKSGMLPPKVARMMVNIGLGKTDLNTHPVVLDPFCGVGTVGMESLMIGSWSINSDKDDEAVAKTRKNLEWASMVYKISADNYEIFSSDAVHVSGKIPKGSVNAIVTEPYLGPMVEISRGRPVINGQQHLTPGILENIITGLEKMYIGSLKDWLSILKPNGKVVIIFPVFNLQGKDNGMKNIVDTCEKIGYNVVQGPIEYHRPQAVVKRNIYVLEVKNQNKIS